MNWERKSRYQPTFGVEGINDIGRDIERRY